MVQKENFARDSPMVQPRRGVNTVLVKSVSADLSKCPQNDEFLESEGRSCLGLILLWMYFQDLQVERVSGLVLVLKYPTECGVPI